MSQSDLVEETIALRDGVLEILRPRDAEALLDEHAFEHEEFLPYWAELWPSGAALARKVSGRALRGAGVLELGCGLGLPSLAAARAGGKVLATDWAPGAIDLLRENAVRNAIALEVARVAWDAPEALVEAAPWAVVLAADVLYERRNVPLLLDLLPRLVAPGRGEIWLADPGRPPEAAFLDGAAQRGFEIASVPDPQHPVVTVHTLRLAAA
ncbi:MAG TPA: methyltransferase domain-containing protein [Solirubrobacteraceae bacterium]|jgi:predicted nicotinamide N-methyase